MKIEKNRPEKFFFQILENSPQGIILFDSLMTCCYFNLKASKILKIKNRDIPVGQKLKELAPGIEKTPRYQKYLDTLSTGRSHTVYFNVEVKSQIKYLQVKSLKVDDNLVLYINDISKIVKQESTYFYVKNYLETLLSAINIPVLIKNINNVYELMNDAIVDVLSTDNEMTQLEFDKKVIGNSKEFHSCENQVLLGKKEKANIEISFKKKDGTIHDFSVVIVPLKNEMNIITGLIEVCFDITELNMTDAELKLLAATVSHSTEGILITDATGIILYVNEAYEELTGYKNEELIGKNPSLLKSGVHPDKFYKKLWKKISKGELWEGLFVNKHKDGTLYREKAVIFPIISDKNKRITNFVAIKRDVTHETELEEQLRQARSSRAFSRWDCS
jgi:PAS domain S-box-containing protein